MPGLRQHESLQEGAVQVRPVRLRQLAAAMRTSMSREKLHSPHADLEAWKKKHPRMSKWHPEWFVDFDLAGSSGPVPHTYSWTATQSLVRQRDAYKCRACGSDGSEQYNTDCSGYTCHYGLEVQHIVPRKDGGIDHPKNLITLCRKCHRTTFKRGYGGVPGLTSGNQHSLQDFEI